MVGIALAEGVGEFPASTLGVGLVVVGVLTDEVEQAAKTIPVKTPRLL